MPMWAPRWPDAPPPRPPATSPTTAPRRALRRLPGRRRCRRTRGFAGSAGCRLGLEAHGLEGLAEVGVHVHSRLLAVAKRPHHGKRHVDGKSGRLGSPALAMGGNHLVAGVAQNLDFKIPVIPGRGPLLEESFRSLNALVDLLLGPAVEVRHVPHELRRNELVDEASAPAKLLIAAAHNRDVLLRHPYPRSSASRAAAALTSSAFVSLVTVISAPR